MRILRFLVVATASVLVAAHGDDLAERAYQIRRALLQRQAVSTSSSTGVSASGTPASSAASTTPASSGASSTSTPSIALASTNPTAVPLSAIVSFKPSSATKPLPATPAAGTIPSLSGAPPIPDASTINPQKYPKLDTIPPTDSPEVQEWIAEVAATGIVIPSFNPTVEGGCTANAAAVADASRCWWSCTGCTRATDITDCPTVLDWGLTYDDGPGYYTSNLLEYLDSQKLKSTFFVVGSRVISFPRILQYEYVNAHQIAVHTWSHHPLTQLTNDQIIAELGWSKKAIKDVLGVTPNTMRAPFGDLDDRVRAISIAMGLTPVVWTRASPQVTFDTDDFNIHSGTTTVYKVLQNWQFILGNVTNLKRGFIVLEHDLFQESVEVATGYILPDALAHNPPFSIKPVITCQNRDLTDAYIETNNNGSNPPPLPAAVAAGVFTTTSVAPGSIKTGASKSPGTPTFSAPVFSIAVTAIIGLLVGTSVL